MFLKILDFFTEHFKCTFQALYDPNFLLGVEKGRNQPIPQGHDSRLKIGKMANKDAYEEVEPLLKAKDDPSKAMAQVFSTPHPKQPEVPTYYTFYRPPRPIVTRDDMKFKAPLKHR